MGQCTTNHINYDLSHTLREHPPDAPQWVGNPSALFLVWKLPLRNDENARGH